MDCPEDDGNITCSSSSDTFCSLANNNGGGRMKIPRNRGNNHVVGTYDNTNLRDHSLDFSNREIAEFPMEILKFGNSLKILYLQNNEMRELPIGFFEKLPNLAWCDLRWNALEMLPDFSKPHTALRVLQIQDNRVPVLPLSLGLHAVNLRTLGLRGNPIHDPPAAIVDLGVDKIREYLVKCYKEEKKEAGGDCSRLEDDADKRLVKYERSLSAFNLNECSSQGPTSIELQTHNIPNLTSALYRRLNKSGGVTRYGGAMSATPRTTALGNLRKRISDNLKYTNDVWRDAPFNGLSGRHLAAKSLEQMRQQILRKFTVQRDKLVQKIKDREMLAKWRFETSELQKAGRKPGTCRMISTPYGTSKDDCASKDGSVGSNHRYIYLSPPEFEREVSSCSKKLQEYVANPSSMNDSEGALRRLQECEDIQRRLCSLKLKTNGCVKGI